MQTIAWPRSQQRSAVAYQQRLAQEEVAKAWDDCFREEAHGRLLPHLPRAGTFVVIRFDCRPGETTDGGAACLQRFFVGGPAAVWLR
jgi:hypothetical protein